MSNKMVSLNYNNKQTCLSLLENKLNYVPTYPVDFLILDKREHIKIKQFC